MEGGRWKVEGGVGQYVAGAVEDGTLGCHWEI